VHTLKQRLARASPPRIHTTREASAPGLPADGAGREVSSSRDRSWADVQVRPGRASGNPAFVGPRKGGGRGAGQRGNRPCWPCRPGRGRGTQSRGPGRSRFFPVGDNHTGWGRAGLPVHTGVPRGGVGEWTAEPTPRCHPLTMAAAQDDVIFAADGARAGSWCLMKMRGGNIDGIGGLVYGLLGTGLSRGTRADDDQDRRPRDPGPRNLVQALRFADGPMGRPRGGGSMAPWVMEGPAGDPRDSGQPPTAVGRGAVDRAATRLGWLVTARPRRE